MRLLFPTTYYHHHSFSRFPSFFSFLHKPPRRAHFMASTVINRRRRQLRKTVVIMGPTGSGKSKLSIDLASRFFPSSEIINTDKIQLYRGLNITSNKIPLADRLGVTHHLLGEIDSSHSLSPSEFRSLASSYISDITSRSRLPLIVGGSNSLIYALLAKRFDPSADVFSGSNPDPICPELRYNCCFLWVDVSLAVLNMYLLRRVDEMLDSGMFEELAKFYNSGEFESVSRTGLGKAIGVPEFERYFRYCCSSSDTRDANSEEDVTRRVIYEEAVKAVKDNTCELAKRQQGKIQRLRNAGWDLRRIDATEAFRAAMVLDKSGDSGRAADIWERQVVEPSVKIVKRFLEEE